MWCVLTCACALSITRRVPYPYPLPAYVHTLSITRICTRRNAHGLKQPERSPNVMRAPGGYTSLPATTCYTSASARSRRLTPSKTAKKSMACPRRGGPHAFSTRESQACLSGSDRPGFEACVAYGGRVLQHARQCTAEERTDAALLAHLCPKARPAWPGGQRGPTRPIGGGWRRLAEAWGAPEASLRLA